MKSLCLAHRISILFLPVLLFVLTFSIVSDGQSRRSKAAPKPSAKKSEKSVKVAKKEVKKDSRSAKKNDSRSAKKSDSRHSSAREKTVAKKDSRRDSKKETAKDRKLTAREKRELAAAEKKNSKKSKAELRKELAERRRIEEERRRAALAEKRRREEAARQARLRQIAFENGLKNETRENILNDSTEGEDMQVRAAAVNALGNKAGTVVVMEAQTGKVVTIVNQDWAVRRSFKPCSTIKLVTGVAGLTEHVINKEGGVGDSTAGWTLGPAIARSNNGYFQRVGVNVGSGKMVSYARQLGLGEPTGINISGETGGRVPNGNNNARIYSHGDDFEVTPLQLAVMTTAISNGGKKMVPQVIRSRTENSSFHPMVKGPVGVPAQELDEVLPGMIGTAEYGTARRGVDATMGVAGKTGSCIYKGTWIGLFTSIAPVENPKYSVVVITRGSGERGKYAAAIAGRVYNALSTRIRPARNLALAQARFGRRSSIQDTSIANAADEDEDDDAMTGDLADAGSNSETDIQQTPADTQYRPMPVQAPVRKPLVTRTGQSAPRFPPVIIKYNKDAAEENKQDNAETRSRPRIVKNK